MDLHGLLALVLLVTAVALFLRRRLPVEVVAMGIPLALMATNTLPWKTALAGFGNTAVIAIAAMCVVGAGLQEAGVTTLLARGLLAVGGRREWVHVLGLMLAGVLLSSFMSTVAAVAVLMPAAMANARRMDYAPSRLLLPLSFGSVLGCYLFQISSVPNMLVSNAAAAAGTTLGMFSFTPYGAPVIAAGIAFVVLVGRHLLPTRDASGRLRGSQLPEEVARSYGLAKTLVRMTLVPESSVVGKTIAASGIRGHYGLDVIAVVRQKPLPPASSGIGQVGLGVFAAVRPKTMGEEFLEPVPELVLMAGDELYVEGDDESAWRFADYETVQYSLAGPAEIDRILGRGMMVAEVGLSPRSNMFGQTVRQLSFRSRFGLNVLSLWRRDESGRQAFADEPLALGDVLLVSGPSPRLQSLSQDPDWVVMTDVSAAEDVRRAPLALLLTLVAILPAAIWPAVPLAVSALSAATLMVATGCLSMPKVYRAIEWRVLLLVIGTLPLGEALREHGVARSIADVMLSAGSHLGPSASYALLFALAALIGMFTTNSTGAVVLSPVAIQMAQDGHVDAARALVAVSLGASCAFMLPIHPWNLLVMGPGGYEAKDFFRVGLPMTIVVAAVAIYTLAS